jgi:hypothetical protein
VCVIERQPKAPEPKEEASMDANRLQAYYDDFIRYSSPGDNIDRDENWLKEELTKAHSLFTRDRSYARDGVIKALQAVTEYLEEGLNWPHHEIELALLPLRQLRSALAALDSGFTEPLLDPAPRGSGGPPLSITDIEFRFFVALAVKARNEKEELDAACHFVSKELDRLGFKRQRLNEAGYYAPIEPTTVKNWFQQMGANWLKIHAAKKLTLEQYLGGFVCVSAANSAPSGAPLAQALLRAIPRIFGHLSV